jgi:two-component system nitrogen regulation sensor histidine kinase NtrY
VKKFFDNMFFRKYGLLILSVILFAASFIFNTFYFKSTSLTREAKLLEKYLHVRQLDFENLVSDTVVINQLVNRQELQQTFVQLAEKDYGIFLYTSGIFGTVSLKFWNQQMALPPPEIHGYKDGEYFLKLPNGYYLAIKQTLPGSGKTNSVVACALILIRSDFFVETTYLPEQFVHNREADKRVVISQSVTSFPVRSLSGQVLLHLEKRTAAAIPYDNTLTNLLRFLAVFLLIIFIQRFTESGFAAVAPWKSVVFLACILFALRLLTYLFPAVLNLRQFELFDPSIYGSNPVQRSLGDLLINSILFCWVVLYTWAKLQNTGFHVDVWKKSVRWAAGIFAIALLLFSTFTLANIIRSLIADSKISFDVMDFFSLNIFTVIGFAVLSILAITYYYFTRLLFLILRPLFGENPVLIYFAIGFTGLFILTWGYGNPMVLFYIPVLVWLLGFTFLMLTQDYLFSRFRINVASSLFWIFIFSVSISAIMLSEIKKVEWGKRKIIAEKLVESTDPSGERLLSIAMAYLDRRFLAGNFNRFYNKQESKIFRDSIITENYSGYLNKYETRLYVYDAEGKPVNNDDDTPLNALNTILEVQSRPTRIAGLYYFETSFDRFTYITKRDVVTDEGKKLGYLFIISNPKKYISEALFPELFRQLKQSEPENSPIYSYAVYNNKKLVSLTSKYPFATALKGSEIPSEEFEIRVNGNYDELWYRAGIDKVVVIARKQESLIETITLFSYIFCSFLFLVVLVRLVTLLIGAFTGRGSFRKIIQFNIRGQVHSTIIFISILSFLIIGIATISFFISRYNRNNIDKLSRTMQVMMNEMQKKMSAHFTADVGLKMYDTASGINLQHLVEDVAEIHDVDVNVYDTDGNLIVSSEANVYAKGVVSKKMNPVAYYHLDRLRQVQHVQKEKIAKLSYLSIYAPVRDEDGKVYAYLNIPYFASQRELNQEISNFLVTIINLNAFIFLVAGIIALFITNRITRSFSLISDKMKIVSLGGINEAIEWNRSDEIGGLVKEYNKMVAKLEESASALAKSEREGAWREMARQVAHEIKNPLTPMKLSIQYLQRAINNNQPDVKQLSSNVAKTLVEQIDHLSKIAADFSQFANIGIVSVEKFDLHEVLTSLNELYRSNPDIEFIWHPVPGKAMLEADKTQMNRLFTNLFANAVEAHQGEGKCRIEVTEERQNGMISISIKDNGEGIAPEMQSRIFMPNFTTKSSGTGLGLAMCKGIVEQAKGKIWFETVQGRGTVFYVQLPMI